MRDYSLHRKTDSQTEPTNCKQGYNEVQDLQSTELLTYDNSVRHVFKQLLILKNTVFETIQLFIDNNQHERNNIHL